MRPREGWYGEEIHHCNDLSMVAQEQAQRPDKEETYARDSEARYALNHRNRV
jgi:hypothetical protein